MKYSLKKSSGSALKTKSCVSCGTFPPMYCFLRHPHDQTSLKTWTPRWTQCNAVQYQNQLVFVFTYCAAPSDFTWIVKTHSPVRHLQHIFILFLVEETYNGILWDQIHSNSGGVAWKSKRKQNIILNQWDPAQIECIYIKSNTDRAFRGETAPSSIQSVTGRFKKIKNTVAATIPLMKHHGHDPKPSWMLFICCLKGHLMLH